MYVALVARLPKQQTSPSDGKSDPLFSRAFINLYLGS